MARILLPEKILQEQNCSVCKKYLSYGPVKLFINEDVKCGRCSTEVDNGAISTVNSIFQHAIFPCINRYEGCTQLLNFQDVPKHEETCIGKQYPCPLCPETQYTPNSLLFLLNHYRTSHKSEIITERFILVDMEKRKEHVYLYCDNLQNLVIFINIHFNGNIMVINPSTPKNLCNVKYKVTVLENGQQKYHSLYQECASFGLCFNALEIDVQTLSLDTFTSILCVFEFDVPATSSAISLSGEARGEKRKRYNAICDRPEDYGNISQSFRLPDFPKQIPDLFLSENFKTNFGSISKRQCGDYYQLLTVFNSTINTICSVCENYFSTSGPYIEIYFCPHIAVCGACYEKGLRRCQDNCTLTYDEVARHYKLLYYCRFGCKRFFKGGELYLHERHCHLNMEAKLNDDEFGKLHFGNYFFKVFSNSKSIIIRNNVVHFNIHSFGSKGRIYVVTDYGFQCIVFFETIGSHLRFRTESEYSPVEYCIKFKIIKQNRLQGDEEVNSFSVSLADSNNLFFAILLRKL